MTAKAIIFDLDGTLLDTLDDLAQATNRVLRTQGFPVHQVAAYRFFVGNGARMLITRALPETARQEAIIQQCLPLMLADYAAHWRDVSRPYDGVPELLTALQQTDLKLAILSNKPHDFTLECVRGLLPDWRFDYVLGQRDGQPPKPDPAGALTIAAAFQIDPADFLYVGDTNTDMQTANAAGMFPVGALWGFRPRAELVANGARILLAHPLELLALCAK